MRNIPSPSIFNERNDLNERGIKDVNGESVNLTVSLPRLNIINKHVFKLNHEPV